MNLPPLPDLAHAIVYAPHVVDEMVRAYGQECARMERERCAKICECLVIPQDAEPYRGTITALAAAIRKDAP